jgi:hypothetical protein
MAEKAATTSTTGASSSATTDKATEKTVLALLEEDDEFQVSMHILLFSPVSYGFLKVLLLLNISSFFACDFLLCLN